jgi:hypothetical protein
MYCLSHSAVSKNSGLLVCDGVSLGFIVTDVSKHRTSSITNSFTLKAESSLILSFHLHLCLPSCGFHSCFQANHIMHAVSPTRVTRPGHYRLLELITVTVSHKKKTPQRGLSPTSCHTLPLLSSYSPQHLSLKHYQSMWETIFTRTHA